MTVLAAIVVTFEVPEDHGGDLSAETTARVLSEIRSHLRPHVQSTAFMTIDPAHLDAIAQMQA